MSIKQEVEVVDGPGVKDQFEQMFQDKRTEYICVASPYFKKFGSSEIKSLWQSQKKPQQKPELKILVSLRLDNFVLRSSDVEAIDDIFQLQEANPESKISIRFHDELHAKIYTTNWCGIVGSANLTWSGFEGGNIEAAVITEDTNEVAKVKGEFNKLWSQSQILTKKGWENQKKKIKVLSRKYGDALNKMHDAIWKAQVALTRIPDDGNDADYYSNLVQCLSWVVQNNRNSSCSKKELIYQLQMGDSKRSSRRVIENRIKFIQEIGLIKQHNSRYRVTKVGANLDGSYDSRWQCFKLLLRWCEQNGDYQLRILLKAVDKKFTDSSSKISLKELRKAIPASKRTDYWERPSKKEVNDETAYKQFRENSCHVRNWLKSLGVLRLIRRGTTTYYGLGDLYKFYLLPEKRKDVSMDERLNEIVSES